MTIPTATDEAAIYQWLSSEEPMCIYAVTETLAPHHAKPIMRDLYERGTVTLAQRRKGDGLYEYRAYRSKRMR